MYNDEEVFASFFIASLYNLLGLSSGLMVFIVFVHLYIHIICLSRIYCNRRDVEGQLAYQAEFMPLTNL